MSLVPTRWQNSLHSFGIGDLQEGKGLRLDLDHFTFGQSRPCQFDRVAFVQIELFHHLPVSCVSPMGPKQLTHAGR